MNRMNYFEQEVSATKEKDLLAKLYFLMHKDVVVGILSFDRETGELTDILELFYKEHLPVGVEWDIVHLRGWWSQRAIPITRPGLKETLNKVGETTNLSLLLANKGLSITDHYWVNNVSDFCKWEDINFFTNYFSDSIGDILFDNKDELTEEELGHLSPSASVIGEMKKRWIISNDRRYLLKVNTNDYSQQCVNEVIATELHKTLGWDNFVRYSLAKVKVNNLVSLGCICEAFTDIKTEFVSIYQIIKHVKKHQSLSMYECIVQELVRLGISEKEIRNFLEYMATTDFLLTNTDRHFNNFGVLRKDNTYNMAPLFDTGNSLFYNSPFIPSKNNLYNIKCTSIWNKETDAFRYFKIPLKLQLERISTFDNVIYSLLLSNTDMPEYRIENICESFRNKTEILDEFYNGKQIWKPDKYR